MTPLGHQKLNSNKEEFIECIDSLFLKLELAYHYQFYKVFGTDDRLNEGKKLWATSLKSFSTETILEGIESVVGSQSYLPTLTDLITCTLGFWCAFCHPTALQTCHRYKEHFH
mgnify:CR=1 FL=1